MPKYSTEGSTTDTSGEATACELCGNDSSSLQEANVAGAQLHVCDGCAPHNDSPDVNNNGTETSDTDSDRTRDVIEKTTDESGYLNRDSSHWEKEGTNYTDDPLPYLITNYGDALREARRDENLTHEELAAQIDVGAEEIELMETGQIRSTSIGGSTVTELEQILAVRLTEEQ